MTIEADPIKPSIETANGPATRVGIVGSPSTTSELTMDVVDEATHGSLLGEMVFTTHELGPDEYLLALGTVGQIETRNRWHEDPNMRGVLRVHGTLPNLSADGDVRTAKVSVQAVYQVDRPTAPFANTPREDGGSMGMSPTTGQAVNRVDQGVVDALVKRHADSVVYLGKIYHSDVRLPMFVRDFNDRATDGAFHTGIFGRSGSGKTAFAAHLMAMQMRHRDLGILVFDPQGQFSNSSLGIPIDLDTWAASMGREVLKLSIATDIQLRPDADLLTELLEQTRFYPLLGIKNRGENRTALLYELGTRLRARAKWNEEEAEDLLVELLTAIKDDPAALARIYKGKAGQDALATAMDDAVKDPTELLSHFGPAHALFKPDGGTNKKRMSLWSVIAKLLAPTTGARPYIVIDLNSRSGHRWLDDDDIRARLMRLIASTLRTQAEKQWQETGKMANCSVIFDEAHRYASAESGDTELSRLANSLVTYARETRKTGVGWTFITQEIKSLNPAIYAQLRVRAFGFGLTSGGDLDRLRDEIGASSALELYKSFPDPTARAGDRSYPFMLSGPVSPLSFTAAPVFLDVFTDVQEFRVANGLPPEI